MITRRALAIGLGASACATANDEPALFEGVYAESFEVMAFIPNAGPEWWATQAERWWVEFTDNTYQAIQSARPHHLPANAGFWLNVVFEGELSAPGGFGHLSGYPRLLRVTHVHSATSPQVESSLPSSSLD